MSDTTHKLETIDYNGSALTYVDAYQDGIRKATVEIDHGRCSVRIVNSPTRSLSFETWRYVSQILESIIQDQEVRS